MIDNEQPQLTIEQQTMQNIQSVQAKKIKYTNLIMDCINKVQEIRYKLDEVILSEEALYSIVEEIIQANFPECATKYVNGKDWKL